MLQQRRGQVPCILSAGSRRAHPHSPHKAKVEAYCADDDRAQRLGRSLGETGDVVAERIRIASPFHDSMLRDTTNRWCTAADSADIGDLAIGTMAKVRPLSKPAQRIGTALVGFLETTLLELRSGKSDHGTTIASDAMRRPVPRGGST